MSDIIDIIKTIEEIIVDGTKSAKSAMKALMDIDEMIETWHTSRKSKVEDTPPMKNVTPKKRIPDAIDVKYHVTESPHPSRNKKSKPSNPK